MPGFGFFYYDSTMIFVLISLVITLAASARVRSTYRRYSAVRSRAGMTGAAAAERILQLSGICDVRIQQVGGQLTDHYDPRQKVLCLSEGVYGSASVAAVGVAAHECGHAIQHSKGYLPLRIRSAVVPVANIGSRLGLPIILIGYFFSRFDVLIPIGIGLFSFGVLFQLVTLPVEFNASRRAVEVISNSGLLYDQEIQGVRKVLSAAALTYVASAAAAILQLIRLVILFGGGRNRD